MSSTQAIDAVRAIRPGSIETLQQEEFVGKFASLIWKRQSVLPELVSEPSPCPALVEGSVRDCDLVLCVGLPGSGKSWFSNALLARNPHGWARISQDDTGSRSSCEGQIGYDPGKRKVLLDRCNPSAEDRIKWLKLAHWATHPICVHFEYEVNLCISRAQNRAGHPTLPPGSRVRNAVAHMQSIYDKPSLGEGFKGIVTIRSFRASQELVSMFSPPVSLFKFPRTTHLLNLGAASDDDVVATDLPTNVKLGSRVVITEKVDGANVGFSLSSDRSVVVQNRSHYVNPTSHEQFKKLGTWVEEHRAGLYEILDRDAHFPERYVLFGEWLAATHSILYTKLLDIFLAFDLYDRNTGTWADRGTISGLLQLTGIQMVPLVSETQGIVPSEQELRSLVQQESKFYNGRVEGIYIKVEDKGKVLSRGKVVRSDFIAGNEHWTKGIIRLNKLDRVS
jgi:atypical dual specificity phosphatase